MRVCPAAGHSNKSSVKVLRAHTRTVARSRCNQPPARPLARSRSLLLIARDWPTQQQRHTQHRRQHSNGNFICCMCARTHARQMTKQESRARASIRRPQRRRRRQTTTAHLSSQRRRPLRFCAVDVVVTTRRATLLRRGDNSAASCACAATRVGARKLNYR